MWSQVTRGIAVVETTLRQLQRDSAQLKRTARTCSVEWKLQELLQKSVIGR